MCAGAQINQVYLQFCIVTVVCPPSPPIRVPSDACAPDFAVTHSLEKIGINHPSARIGTDNLKLRLKVGGSSIMMRNGPDCNTELSNIRNLERDRTER